MVGNGWGMVGRFGGFGGKRVHDRTYGLVWVQLLVGVNQLHGEFRKIDGSLRL